MKRRNRNLRLRTGVVLSDTIWEVSYDGGHEPAGFSRDPPCVHSSATSPRKPPSFTLFYNCRLFSWIEAQGYSSFLSPTLFFFALGSMIFSPLNLAVLLEIWVVVVVFRLGSRAFCGTLRYDGDHALALESSSEVCSSEVFLPASLTEDSRVPPPPSPCPSRV